MADAYLDRTEELKREEESIDDTLQPPAKKPNLSHPPNQELADSPLPNPLEHVIDADTNSVTHEKLALPSHASKTNTKPSPSSASPPPPRPLGPPQQALPETTIDPCVNIEDGPAGYNHSKVNRASSLNFQLPPWIITTQFTNEVVPALPIIGDPAIFLDFFETQVDQERLKDHHYARFGQLYPEEFKDLAYIGDITLGYFCDSLVRDLFGQDNRRLVHSIKDDWKSNVNWSLLSISYRLDRYVGRKPRNVYNFAGLKWNDPSVQKMLEKGGKFWADIWEAWWAAIFKERELWNEDIEDAKFFFRHLILSKYRLIMEQYSTDYIIDHDIQGFVSIRMTKDQVSTREVKRADPLIVDCLGPPSPKKEDYVFGYLGTISIPNSATSSSNHPPMKSIDKTISVFAVCKEVAISKVLNLINSGLTILPKTLGSIREGYNLGNDIRQKVFDIMVEHWLGKGIPLSKTEDLQPVYAQIRELGRCLIGLSPISVFNTRMKDFAMLFWYEVTLALRLEDYTAALNALLCVISYCVMNMPENYRLLRRCILHYDQIVLNVMEVKSLEYSNFVLKLTMDPVLRSGKLIIHGNEVTSWGTGTDKMRIAISIQFDKYGISRLNNLRNHDTRPWGSLKFMSEIWSGNWKIEDN